ncbi:uncharacterized protein [Antedon mediterranea]|uniref:uncharacterized protein n=1 Tax=Antedon mediterranea TaxID=105859 RepID=UPI003AF9792D
MPTEEGDEDLPNANTEKDLGVTFDQSLKFSIHTNEAVNKANRLIGLVRRSFAYMDKDMFLPLYYKSIIRPHLEYASCIWYPLLKGDLDKLERVQRRATKIVKKLRDKSYDQRLKELGLPTLNYRRRRADIIQVFKIIKGLDDIEAETFFDFREDSRTRGHQFKLRKPRARLKIRSHSFSCRIVNTWNNLYHTTVQAENINAFKDQLNKDRAMGDKFCYQF